MTQTATSPWRTDAPARNYGDRREGYPYDMGEQLNATFKAVWRARQAARKKAQQLWDACIEEAGVKPSDRLFNPPTPYSKEWLKWIEYTVKYEHESNMVMIWSAELRTLARIRRAGRLGHAY
jgi:hypothetical protein